MVYLGGAQVMRILHEQSADLTARVGAPIELAGVAVRRPNRHPDVPPHLLTTDAEALVASSDVDIVVEVVGGLDPVRGWLLSALEKGKSVVSANKALLAEHAADLFAAAETSGADLYFEAAVAGAIPLVRPLRESLAGDHITRVMGIVNGTTNYILTEMERGHAYADVLAEAQRLGYAEADPSGDVEGHDAAGKAVILANVLMGAQLTPADVERSGITGITGAATPNPAQVQAAVARIKRHTTLPVAVGFGVKTGEHARAIAEGADGVVVGSVLVDAVKDSLSEGKGTPRTVTAVADLVAQLADGVRGAKRRAAE